MKSKQILSIEQMQHLQELGMDTSNASMYWISYNGISVSIPSNSHLPTSDNDYVICDAYTLQDVLDALPRFVTYQNRTYDLLINMEQYVMEYFRESDIDTLVGVKFENTSLIDAAYAMLCWCIENGHIKTERGNKK